MVSAPSFTRADVEILSERQGYRGFFRVRVVELRHRLFAGGWSAPLTREVFERGHAAAVLPFDPMRDEVVLVEQFRIGALDDHRGPWLLEPVAGMIEPGEDAQAVVRRESVEECGQELADLVLVGDYVASPGGSSERTTLFVGRVDSAAACGVHGHAEEGEDIRVHVLPFGHAMAMVDRGEIRAANSLIALLWLARGRARLRRMWTAPPDT